MPSLLLTLLILVPLLSGCSSISYYSQAISGHFSFMAKRQPIQQLLDDNEVQGALRERLLLALSIRDFASDALKLPDNASYRSFVPLAGEAVVWSLVATDAFSVEPKQWCYPVIGCASYRGYFDPDDAQAHAAKLETEGLDVALEPVPAYSTLGWFDDPLPGTVVHWNDWQLAGLIFHELAHQRLYIADDSAFNEAFANTVQQAGVAAWLDAMHNTDRSAAWRLSRQRESAFVHLLLKTRERLKSLYQSPMGETERAGRKRAAFDRLVSDYQSLQQGWQGYLGYDAWFERKLNNARLASVATYEEWVPAFQLLLERANGDFDTFYQACEKLAELPAGKRRLQMMQLRRVANQQKLEDPSRQIPLSQETGVYQSRLTDPPTSKLSAQFLVAAPR